MALLGVAIGGFGNSFTSRSGCPTEFPVFDRTFDGDAPRTGPKMRRRQNAARKARAKLLAWRGR